MLDKSSLTFTTSLTTYTPPSQFVTATVTGVSGPLYIKVVSTGPAVSSVSSITITSGTTGEARVYPASASTLGPGTYSSTITVSACTSGPSCTTGHLAGSPATIAVTYTIAGITASAPRLDYTIGNAPSPADFDASFAVTGYPDQTWQATSSAPWLSLAPQSGNAVAPVQVHATVSQEAADVMFDGSYVGTITITPTSGLVLRIPVSLEVRRTEVNHVSPYVAYSGTSREVTIRGDELDLIAPITTVTFGDASATALTHVSDTELRATHPALAPGRHPVRVQGAQGSARSYAELVVVDEPVFAATSLPYPDSRTRQVNDFCYDAERKALLVASGDQAGASYNELFRYAYDGSWSAASRQPYPSLTAIALAADGRSLFAAAGATTIAHLDPTTLATGTVTTFSLAYFEHIEGFGVTNDGRAVALSASSSASGSSPAHRYSPRERTLTRISTPDDFERGSIAASGDGSRVLLASAWWSGDPVVKYEASTGVATPTTFERNVSSVALDGTGSRAILQFLWNSAPRWEVFDWSLASLGLLPADTKAAVLSPDGARAYTFERRPLTGAATSGVVRTFDLTAPTVGGYFQEVGTEVTLAAYPGDPAYGSSDANLVRMTISPDGGTLFLAGSHAVVVQPVP
jgi:hypothetical protein